LRVFISTLAGVAAVLSGATAGLADELRTLSRNTLVFVDAGVEGGEWAAYRLVDAQSPVIFRAEGPGRVLLKLRTIVQEDKDKDAVAAILKDQEIILTARVEPEKDPSVALVEGRGKRSPSKPRMYIVRLEPGEHTVTIRYSEGRPLLVSARFGSAGGADGAIALVAPAREGQDSVQRIGRIRADEVGGIEEVADEQLFESIDRGAEDRAPARSHPADSGDWGTRGRRRADEGDARRIGPGEDLAPFSHERRSSAGAVGRRRLTVPAPYFIYEVRAGALFSALKLDPGAQLGMSARIPLPGVDSRRWTIGLSLDGSYARGSSQVVDESGRAVIDVAKIQRLALEIGGDVRWVPARIEDLVDPYIALGAAAIVGRLSAEDASGGQSGPATGYIGTTRAGAAFGPLGRRPFLEVELALGRMSSPLTRADPSNAIDRGSSYFAVSALVGYRFELLTEAPTE
jgi:hypothetical protein